MRARCPRCLRDTPRHDDIRLLEEDLPTTTVAGLVVAVRTLEHPVRRGHDRVATVDLESHSYSLTTHGALHAYCHSNEVGMMVVPGYHRQNPPGHGDTAGNSCRGRSCDAGSGEMGKVAAEVASCDKDDSSRDTN